MTSCYHHSRLQTSWRERAYCICRLCNSFAIILERRKKLVALLLLSYRCIVTINVLWLFLMVPRVGLQYVIVVFPDHYTHLLFGLLQQIASQICDNSSYCIRVMSYFMRLWYLSHMQAVKAQTSLHSCSVLPELSLPATSWVDPGVGWGNPSWKITSENRFP